jgi:hypothetical protein
MLIGQLVQLVQAVEEVAPHHLVIAVEYQNHAVDVNPLADAHSAKHFLGKSAQKYYF